MDPSEEPKFVIVPADEQGNNPESIICLVCGSRSFHPMDVFAKECPRCFDRIIGNDE